jgi:P27 family predicted phage terminase small subunit
MTDITSRKKARKPASLKTGDYTKEEKEKQNQEKEFLEQFSRNDLENVPQTLNEYGSFYYKLLIEHLKQITLIADIDKPSLTNLAFILGVLEESHIDVKNNGLIAQTSHGKKPSPSLKIIKDYTTLYMNLAKSMALTPEMRQHLQKLTEQNTSQFASEESVSLINNLLDGKFEYE